MLFRTVYGPELKAIYQFVDASEAPLNRQSIINAFMPTAVGETVTSPQNVEDALSFLVSSYLLEERDGILVGVGIDKPFPLALLENLRALERGTLRPKHPLDAHYTALLYHLFIWPDLLFSDNLHGRANSMEAVKLSGGISKEKIQAWKRVMEYLGLGYRINRGFMCVVSPELLVAIVETLTEETAPLQHFFEHIAARFIPYLNSTGDVAQAIRQPLLYLAETGIIRLSSLQDSPHKSYFQPHGFRQIRRERIYATV